MQKQEALDQLLAAKYAHMRWLARAQALVANVPLSEEQVPVTDTDCEFGQWYYGPGQRLSGMRSFRAIEAPHHQLHHIYGKIFAHLHGDARRSLPRRLLGSRTPTGGQRLAAAQDLLPDLNSVSVNLLTAVAVLEQELRKGPEGG